MPNITRVLAKGKGSLSIPGIFSRQKQLPFGSARPSARNRWVSQHGDAINHTRPACSMQPGHSAGWVYQSPELPHKSGQQQAGLLFLRGESDSPVVFFHRPSIGRAGRSCRKSNPRAPILAVDPGRADSGEIAAATTANTTRETGSQARPWPL